MATRINTYRNPAYKADGFKSLIYMLRKYKVKPSKDLTRLRHLTKLEIKDLDDEAWASEVDARNQQNDSFWLTPVTIGTPGQELLLNFDTGSSDLWIWSTELPKSFLSQGKELGNEAFNPEESSTYKQVDDSTWQITYGDRSNASGFVGLDTVTIGDIKVENQAIELATDLSSEFVQNAGSGLLGLGWGTINTVQPKPVMTPLENMIAQEDIPEDKSLFTAYLGSFKDANDPDKGESFYTFGAIDKDAVKSSGQDIHWTPVDNSQGFWEYESVTATIDGEEFSMPGNRAMADTGTTLWMANDELCKAIYNKIPGAKMDYAAGGYTYPADVAIDSLPQITFAIGDKQFNLEKEHIGFAPVDESGTTIFGGIQPRGSDLPFDIMGDTVLMCLYAIFDVGKKRFGCVQRADPTPAGEGSASGEPDISK